MKRNIFLSVFLPLFLCTAILTLGYFSPTLFSRVMPNFKTRKVPRRLPARKARCIWKTPPVLSCRRGMILMILNHRCTLPITSLFRTP